MCVCVCVSINACIINGMYTVFVHTFTSWVHLKSEITINVLSSLMIVKLCHFEST